MHAERPAIAGLPAQCWQRLEQAAASADDPWHTPALANLDKDGPQVRCVVLRAVSAAERTLICHTDIRSPKARALAADPRVRWLFYDPEARLQLRAKGTAEQLHSGAFAEQQWHALHAGSQALYGQDGPPGMALTEGQSAGQERTHFLALRCQIEQLDWLQLGRQAHWRAALRWRGGQWQTQWINP